MYRESEGEEEKGRRIEKLMEWMEGLGRSKQKSQKADMITERTRRRWER